VYKKISKTIGGKSYLYYIFAKTVGLVFKPLLLYFSIQYSVKDDTNLLAIVLLLLSGLMIIYSLPVHFDFYKLFFGEGKNISQCKSSFIKYMTYLSEHIFVFSPIVFIVSEYVIEDVVLSILMVVLLISEKIMDELLRFLQFSKRFVLWSNIFLIKALAPVSIVVVLFLFMGLHVSVTYIYLSIVVNFLIVVFIMPKAIFGIFSKLHFDMLQYAKQLKLKLTKFIFQVTNANISNIDKWFLAFVKLKALTTELVFVSQFMNGILVFGNYAFIANRRSELVDKNNNIDTLWLDLKVPLIMSIIGSILAVFFIFSMVFELVEFEYISNTVIICLSISYVLFSITQPITEYLFWNSNVTRLILVDVLYYLLFVILGVVGLNFYSIVSLEYISIIFLVLSCIRLILIVFRLQRHKKYC